MSIPSVPDLTLPLLKALSDGSPHTVAELRDAVALTTGVSSDDRKLYLPSGSVRTYDNRVGWALKELKVAGLVTAPSRAVYQVTAEGRGLLSRGPTRLDRGFLVTHYPAARAFYAALAAPASGTLTSGSPSVAAPPPADATSETDPIEAIESAVSSLRDDLANDLAKRIQDNSPGFFEELVIDLVVALGYGNSRAEAARHLGRTGDGGVDGVVYEDRLGLSRVFLQAKRYAPDRSIEVDTVRAFSGSLDEQRSDKGILIATCKFTRPAREFAERSQKHIRLIDGTELTQLMIDAGIGVTPAKTYTVKRVDSDYFDESSPV